MPRGANAATPTESDLDALISAAGPPTAPENYGNFPDPSAQSVTPPVESPVEAAPVVEAAPEPEGEDEPTPPVVAEEAPKNEEWERRLAALERENQFLRLGIERPSAPPPVQTPESAVAAIDALLGGYKVTPEDVQVIVSDPVRGAEYLQNGIRAAIGAALTGAIAQTRQEAAESARTQGEGQRLNQLMYSQHPELAPYADQVMLEAQKLFRPGMDAQTVVNETARATRAKLKTWGVTLESKPTVARPRPARAEGSGTGRRATNGVANSFEKDLFQLANR